ncbi:MAG: hypothetical protein AAGF01_10805 [Cyanobacteria bacterium P01_G01_bin.38]
MLIASDLASTLTTTSALTVKELVQTWAGRYRPQTHRNGRNLVVQNTIIFDSLVQTALPEGRRETVTKLHRSLIKLNCEFAETQTRELHDYDSSKSGLSETKRIVQCAVEIYLTLLEFYQRSLSVPTQKTQDGEDDHEPSLGGLSVSDIIELASLIEPLLLEYQERHQVSDDWSRVGFLTTHINFSNVALLKNLTPAEQFFIEPYFKFLEEQVALPWQRICAAAGTHQYISPAFRLVKRMLPDAEEIAYRVYMNLLQQFPKTFMKRGRLDHPGVRHSCIRDLNMFQAYLWLCVLQGSFEPVEDELIRLCTMVMPRVGVPWEMTTQWNELLMTEVMDRTLLSHQAFLEPYMTRFIQTFQQSQDKFAAES